MYFVPHPLSADTFVSAAVSVVFPWSTWPIVPTFTCGFVRSNFAFPMTDTETQKGWTATSPRGSNIPSGRNYTSACPPYPLRRHAHSADASSPLLHDTQTNGS